MTKSALSAPRKRLVEGMQEMNFGHYVGLVVRNGDPVFDPPPRQVFEVKFGATNGPRPEHRADDFLLKAQVVELFQHFDRLGDGVVESLEVKNGLPFRMLIRGDAA
jgi:hypothetical protein